MLNSDQIGAFLAVVREGNCVAAARRLRLDHSTVSRRLASLEAQLGTRLFDRSPRGLAPTAAASAFLAHAERIERDLIVAADAVSQRDAPIVGTVRVATPEIFGSDFLAPLIPELSRRHPELVIELVPESRATSLSKREADIAIAVRRPLDGRLFSRKLTDYRLGLFAAPSYLETFGMPASIGALSDHRYISYVDDLVEVPELLVLGGMDLKGKVVFRASTSSAQIAAAAAGTGLAMLHHIAVRDDPRLVRVLEEEIEASRSYWLVIHADLRQLTRVRAVAEFLAEVVSRERARF
ncbi:LysR family transcriptional regulator [Sphingopyxis sp. JAI128]|uniref:LysR family transcriptional regulator n=1 Tax=Sphingopyxis sp. JAI128 TaxID=2723066 RepID=UPI0016081C38|nr:LysR family transcriptional regulator [Sphingopyxis sp. JAI128]MBB6427165.1 DNA-binding transcriptional LysR family regulator [Sphingopyxis sp. JAI128]